MSEDPTEKAVWSVIARRFMWAFIVGGASILVAGTLWAGRVDMRLKNIEDTRITREEAASLKASIDLLRLEVGYLRQAIQRPQ